MFRRVHDDVVCLVLSFVAAPAGKPTSMCPATLKPYKDPRLQPRVPPRVEQPQETISEWQGVLLMADKTKTKVNRIAEVTCRPAPPVPLPQRVQVEKEFVKLEPAQRQVCIGLPFFELHKPGYSYHRDSEWCKFLHFMHDSQKFATVTCEGWQLFVRPPDVGPPDGFSSVRVHYRCMSQAGAVLLTSPPIVPKDPTPSPSFQEWASQPAGSSGGDMEVESSPAVLKRPIDFTAKLSCQPKVKRPRVGGNSFPGFGSTSTNTRADSLSSSQHNLELQELVSKAKEKPKSVANFVNDVVYDISPSIDRASNPPVAYGNGTNTWDKGKVSASVDGGAFEMEAHGIGLLGNGVTSGAAPTVVDDRWERYKTREELPSGGGDSGVVEKRSQGSSGSTRLQGASNGVKENNITSGAVTVNRDWMKKYVAGASGPKAILPSGGSDIGVVEIERLQASENTQGVSNGGKEKGPEMMANCGATTLGAAPANQDWMEKHHVAEAAGPKAASGGGDSSAAEKPSRIMSGSFTMVKEKTVLECPPKLNGLNRGVRSRPAPRKDKSELGPPRKSSSNDMPTLPESSQAKEKLKGGQETAPMPGMPVLGSLNLNADFWIQKGSQVVDKSPDKGKEMADKSADKGKEISDKTTDKGKEIADKTTDKGKEMPDKTTDKGKEMAHKGEGVSNGGVPVSLKSKQVPKSASNGNGNIVKRQCRRKSSFYLFNPNVAKPQVVQALQAVPEKYRVGITKSGVAATMKEQMPKPPSSGNNALQKHKCSQSEAKLPEELPPASIDNFVELKSSKEATKQKDAPSTISGMDSQQTKKFVNAVTRSKPQKIQLKKTPIGGASNDEGNTSTSPKKGEIIRWEQWRRVIENVLQVMYLAEDRNAAIVDVGVEEVYWPAEKRNVVAVTIGDDGVGMASIEKEFFDLEEFKDIPADYLILLTKSEKEQLIALTYKHDLKCLSYFKYDGDDATTDAKQLSLQNALGTIEKLSPFSNASSFMEEEFAKIKTKGTRMIVYGYGDLVFKQENVKEEDGIVRKSMQTSTQNGMTQLSNGFDMDKRTFIKILRSYAEASYLRPEVMIQVQGTRVKKSLGERLSADGIQYIKRMEKEEISLSLSTNKIGSRSETSGICLYYQNRLLEGHEAFLKVGKMVEDSNYGLGVVGVVDITSLLDCHGAQRDFKGSRYYNMFMYWLADKVHEYCDGLDLVENGRKGEHNIHNSSQLDLDENISKIMSQGQIQEAKDVCEDQTNDLASPLLDSPLLESPQVAGCSNSKTLKRCNDCREWREMPFGTEIDLLPVCWTCDMLPFNRPCRSQAEDIADDEVPLSKLLKSTSLADDDHESESKDLESNDEDFEPHDEESKPLDEDSEQKDEEYEVEKILDTKVESDGIKYLVKWIGYHHDESTWEPPSHLTNAKEVVEEYFNRHPLKGLEMKKRGFI